MDRVVVSVNVTMEYDLLEDFYSRAKRIKKEFQELGPEEKKVYKMYVYSHRLMKDWVCDKIWEYLNEPNSSRYKISYNQLGKYTNKKRL